MSDLESEEAQQPASHFWPPIGELTPPPKKRRGPEPGYTVVTRQKVLDAIAELTAAGRIASRPTIANVLGVPVGKVDDGVKALYEDGVIRRVIAGVYELTAPFRESRAVSLTRLPSGLVKLEVDDTCIELTGHECRALASMLLGSAFDFSLVTSNRDLADQIADLRALHYRSKEEIGRRLEEMERPEQPALSRPRKGAGG